MIKIDWSNAPDDATDALLVNGAQWFYKIMDGKLYYYTSDKIWYLSGHPVALLECGGDEYYAFIPRIKPRIIYKGGYSTLYQNDSALVTRYKKESSRACSVRLVPIDNDKLVVE